MNRSIAPVVETEEIIYDYENPDNGAGALWCYGSTCIVRSGDRLYVSGIEKVDGAKSYNNIRWSLFRRESDGWKRLVSDQVNLTREPCPVAAFEDGRIYLSANPTRASEGEIKGPAEPQVLKLTQKAGTVAYTNLPPDWNGTPDFTAHSYRGLCSDPAEKQLLLMNIENLDRYHYSVMDTDERWIHRGTLEFPWGDEYETPQRVRICYPELIMRSGAVHFFGISDIVEPVSAWRKAKLEITGRKWDYDFRRLFYTYTPDISSSPFVDWIEIAGREKTAGHMKNLDMWIGRSGEVHLLWIDARCDLRIRSLFFPDTPYTVALKHGVLRNGRLEAVATLMEGGEGLSDRLPIWGRFHTTTDGRIHVFYADGTWMKDGGSYPPEMQEIENHISVLNSDGVWAESVKVPLKKPLEGGFMTAARSGCTESDRLDLIGKAAGTDNLHPERTTIRYIGIRIK